MKTEKCIEEEECVERKNRGEIRKKNGEKKRRREEGKERREKRRQKLHVQEAKRQKVREEVTDH